MLTQTARAAASQLKFSSTIGLLSLHNPVARAARALAERYTACEQASGTARKGLYWFSKLLVAARGAHEERARKALVRDLKLNKAICTCNLITYWHARSMLTRIA